MIFNCKHCNKEGKAKHNNPNQRYCNRECYSLWVIANPSSAKFGRKKGIDPKLDEGAKPTFTHSFSKIVNYPLPTGTFPMFL